MTINAIFHNASKTFSVERDGSRPANCTPFYPSRAQRALFQAADAVASLSDHRQAKLGCILVSGHRILSSGHNSSTRCSSFQKQMDTARFGFPDQHKGTVHAETACLLPFIRQGIDVSGSDIYLSRRHRDGSLALSRPCPGCMSLLRAVGVKRAYFSVEGGYAMERIWGIKERDREGKSGNETDKKSPKERDRHPLPSNNPPNLPSQQDCLYVIQRNTRLRVYPYTP